MKRVLSVALAFAAYTAVACGGDDEPTNGGGQPGVPANVAVVSGDGQKVATSSEVIDPLVVKVTDGPGNGVRGVTVTWAVTSGGGSLSATTSVTDVYGETEVYLTAGSAEGENSATATVEGLPSPATFTANGVEPASISIVSGDDQMGRTGQSLAELLVVKVLGTDNQPLPGARIDWDASQGGGGTMNPAESYSDNQGNASSSLVLGNFPVPYTIVATVKTKTSLTVEFGALGTAPQTVEVEIQNNQFNAPGGGDEVTILLGDAVRWLNRDSQVHTATSNDEPEGGMAFDSGDIVQNGTFTFTPRVRGRWIYHCSYYPQTMAGAQIIVE